MKKRLFAALVSLCMIVPMLPITAFAEAGVQDSGIVTSASRLCEHHTQHDESCGYTEGTAEIPCSHEHNESCGGLTDPATCNHTHDEACGYVPATEGTPCTFVCEVCNAQDSGDAATPSDVQPEECTCETLCTGEKINADCPVCSVEGAELDKVCVGAALLLTAPTLRTGEIKLFIGGQQITESGCYEKNQDGDWTKVEDSDGTEPANGQFYYDAATFTLTLNQAEITHNQTVNVAEGYTYDGSVIAFSQTAEVSLKIVVSQGTSTITGTGGIRVESTTGNASLSIKGSGSLDVEPKGSNSGITLCSSKNTNLDIDGADVTASSPAQYGVYLISSTDASSTSTITVNNGSLTTGGNGNVGIYYYWSGTNNAGTSSLTVSGNAVVDTRNSQIMAQNKETVVQVGAGSDGNGGIVFNGKNGTVYGKVELQDDLTINEGETLTVGKDASLTVPDGKTLTNDGTITVESGGKLEGTTTGNGTLKIAPTIITQPQDVEVKENETATFTVKVTGTEPLSYQWQQSTDKGSSWTNIDSATSDTYTTGKTTIDMSGTQYRCVVKNSIDEVTSDAALLTVKHNLVKAEYKAPTCTVNGNEEYWICENCGKYFSDANGDTEIEKDSWIISAINHSWNDAVYTWSDDGSTCTATRTCKNDSTHTETSKATVTGAQTKAPTCTEKGETTYKATFEADWAMTQTKVLADIPATGHSYGEPVWSWSEDGKTCTVTFTCEKDENHKESPKVTVTSAEKAPATCTEAGVTTYTATVEFNGKTYTDTKDVADIPATGHSYGEPVWSWAEDGKTCKVTFTCEKDENHKKTPEVKVTSAVKTPATCTEKGVTTYTATVEFNGKTYTDTKDLTDIPATDHSYGEPVWNWSEGGKTCTVTFICEKDETHKETPKVKITSAVKTPATCTEAGVTTYTATVEFNGKTHTDTKDVADIPAIGHKLTKTEAKAPTSTDTGNIEYWYCKVCDKYFSDEKAEHEITLEDTIIAKLPKLISGANQEWTKGSKDGLTFKVDTDINEFKKVLVDGKELKDTNYDIKSGSTILTLKSSFLDTLSAGKHQICLEFNNGTIEAYFTVKVKETTTVPETGEQTNLYLWAMLAIASSASILVLRRYKKYNR